jgi:hypothetical protein
MSAPRDLDKQLDAFLLEGPTELPDPSFDAVRGRMESTRQRVVFGPWRMPDMNKFLAIGLGGAAVVVALVIGAQLLGPAAGSGVGGAPSATPSPIPSPTPVGGIVEFGIGETTEVDAVADGASVSGTAVSTLVSGTHAVRVECAARDGDTWAFGGTIEETTVPGESAGSWSAVIVRGDSPQQVGIWLSDDKQEGSDCDGWLGSIDLNTIDAENFVPVKSGELVPPPGLAP